VILTGWPVTVGVVEVGVYSQPGADAERYWCACLHCTQGLAGRGDGLTGMSAASTGGVVVVSSSRILFNHSALLP